MGVTVNYIAIVAAVVASMALGFIWYGPLFGQKWMKLMGLTKENINAAKKEMGKMYGISFVMALITAYVLSHVMTLSENYFQYARLQTGVTTAFWMWLGFIMPVQVTDVIFGGKKWDLFAINTGYQLASVVAMGVVLGIM